MVVTNWRDAAPTIVHDFGIDYKLLKGQEAYDPGIPNCCRRARRTRLTPTGITRRFTISFPA